MVWRPKFWDATGAVIRSGRELMAAAGRHPSERRGVRRRDVKVSQTIKNCGASRRCDCQSRLRSCESGPSIFDVQVIALHPFHSSALQFCGGVFLRPVRLVQIADGVISVLAQ